MPDVPAASLSVELLVVPDCPSRAPAHAQLRAVLDGLGLTDTPILTTVVDSDDAAAARGFTGSPSLRINGVDPIPSSGSVGMSCRLYRSATGLSGLPASTDIRSAILAAASQ
ncbi:MAG: hypothetical protein ABI047_10845 [Jatrophihabitantaceae bacterium]